MLFRWFKYIVWSILAVIVIIAVYLLFPIKIKPADNIAWGATFTKSYAEYLGLDWKQTYLAVLGDLGLKAVRIGINWDEIETVQGKFNFVDYDWMFDQAEKRGMKILPVLGFKLPRWPECRAPEWALGWVPKESSFIKRNLGFGAGSERDKFENAQLAMVQKVVEHFKNRTSIKEWQVENEAFVGWFGNCPPIPSAFTRREADLVRRLDPRPILMTESGELSFGLRSALAADIVGTTLYREVWSPIFGFITYPLPPSFYARKAGLLAPWISKFIVSELQLEAWAPQGIVNVPIQEQLAQVPPEKIKSRLDYARRTGIDEIYVWGVEWWWWLKVNGYPQLWEVAREEFIR